MTIFKPGVTQGPLSLLQEFVKELFKWNPHVDLKDFNFFDDKFVEMCKNRDPVSCDSSELAFSMYCTDIPRYNYVGLILRPGMESKVITKRCNSIHTVTASSA